MGLLEKYITLKEFSDMLGVHMETAKRHFLPKVRHIHIGKRIMILKKDAEEVVKNLDVEKGGGKGG